MTVKNLGLNDIQGLDFTTLCSRIADAYSSDVSAVDGDVFAHLAKRLIAAEIQPGGPYNDENGQSTIRLNAAIGRLFLLMDHPLPNVDTYLTEADAPSTRADREALKRYKMTRREALQKEKSSPKQHASYRHATRTLAALDEPVKTQGLQFLARIETADTTREIAAISQFTMHALKSDGISSAKLNTLGEANVHSWIAYTIYDHIIDKEAGTVLLPTANICMRLALAGYRRALPLQHPLQRLITEYFDKVDAISAWEITSCRFTVTDGLIEIRTLPDYQQYDVLAWRSCIHILGPLIVASFTASLLSQDAEHLTTGLRHYLIARQLGDDIHDWREDLVAGRISAVVAFLLVRQKVQEHSIHSLDTLVPAIQEDFLDVGAVEVSKLILKHTNHALSELALAGCDPSSELVGLVDRLERMANGSIRHQQRFVSFQGEYGATQTNHLHKL